MLRSVETSTLVVLTDLAAAVSDAEAAAVVDEDEEDAAAAADGAPVPAAGVEVPEDALLLPLAGLSSWPTSFAFSAMSSALNA